MPLQLREAAEYTASPISRRALKYSTSPATPMTVTGGHVDAAATVHSAFSNRRFARIILCRPMRRLQTTTGGAITGIGETMNIRPSMSGMPSVDEISSGHTPATAIDRLCLSGRDRLVEQIEIVDVAEQRPAATNRVKTDRRHAGRLPQPAGLDATSEVLQLSGSV